MFAKQGGEIRQGAMIAAATDREVASAYLRRTEDLLSRQAGQSIDGVRPAIARRLEVSVSALQFIRRKRRKIVPGWLKERIVALFIEAAQKELRAIEHEIEVARQIGLGNSDGRLVKARSRAADLLQIIENVSSECKGDGA